MSLENKELILSIEEREKNKDCWSSVFQQLQNSYGGVISENYQLLKQEVVTHNKISKTHQTAIIANQFQIMYPQHDQECKELLSLISSNQISSYFGQTQRILHYMTEM